MVRLISYATRSFWQSAKLLSMSAKRFGVDDVRIYGPGDLVGSRFYEENKAILSAPRGAGYWIWKSYLIQQELQQLRPEDVLVYADSGIEITGDLSPLVALSRDSKLPIVVSDFMRLNREYCKRDCYLAMDADRPEIYDAAQVVGGFNLHRATPESIEFVNEWARYSQTDELITDAPSNMGQPELDGFIAHRHDQSILSILVAKMGVPIYRDPSPYGVRWKGVPTGPGAADWRSASVMAASNYDEMIVVHRLRNKKPQHILEMSRRMLRHWRATR